MERPSVDVSTFHNISRMLSRGFLDSLKKNPIESYHRISVVWILRLQNPSGLEEEMATHSSILAWRIPWTEEPDRL